MSQQNMNNNSPDSSQNDGESLKYDTIGVQPQSQPHVALVAQQQNASGLNQSASQQPETWSAHLAAAAQNSNTGSSSSMAGAQQHLTDQQLLINQQQNRNIKISPQLQLSHQYGHQMHNNSYDDNSSDRGSPQERQIMMGPNRAGNLNLKSDAFAALGASDAEIAQAQAEYRSQAALINMGHMSALQSSGA